MDQKLKALVKRLPPFKALLAERDALEQAAGFVPPGHFYSPIVSIAEATRDEARIFKAPSASVAGVELDDAGQLALLGTFEQYYASIPFPATRTAGHRYYYENPAYSYSDAIFLHCMIRFLAPARIVEVGSGFSSCAMLDTNEAFFGNRIATRFIEPYPALLQSLISDDDRRRVEVIPRRLQDVDPKVFTELEPNDILFVDSTHVSKAGSDVNCLFFDILPLLNPGVYVHLHDVFYPFEYPKEWIMGGRSWNEIYLLRAFLQYNSRFRVAFLNTFVSWKHGERIARTMPACLKNPGGSIWLERV